MLILCTSLNAYLNFARLGTTGPIFSAITLTLNLHISPPFYIGSKGKVKLKWSGENGSRSPNFEEVNLYGSPVFISQLIQRSYPKSKRPLELWCLSVIAFLYELELVNGKSKILGCIHKLKVLMRPLTIVPNSVKFRWRIRTILEK